MNFGYGKVSLALIFSLLLGPQVGWAQTGAPLWQPAPAPAARNGDAGPPTAGRWFTLDAPQLAARLASAPPETRPAAAVTLELPYPDGTLHRFALTKVPVMAPALAAKFPQIQTYAGHGLDEPTASVRLETAPAGLHAQVLGLPGGPLSIETAPGTTNPYRSHADGQPAFDCRALPVPGRGQRPTGGTPPAPPAPYGSQLRVLRLALATTGEYYQSPAFGNNSPTTTLASLVALVSALNAVYERELSVRLELIGNNNLLIYPDPATDPYTNSSPGTMIDESRASINTVIGSANYDIGHVLGYRAGGYSGVAYIGVTCFDDFKGGGASTGATPGLMATVATHEMGHQLGSGHTFNGDKGNCSGNRSSTLAYEPGAGNTIMSYDSRCSPDNVGAGIPYFHAGSLSAIIADLGNACGTFTATGNQAPILTVPPSNTYTIPLGTPFALAGTGTDPDGDAPAYSWEELDLGDPTGLAGAASDASGPPLFRSFAPVASPVRTFPNPASLLANAASVGEILPQVARTLNFRLTARDNRSGVTGANVTLAVASAGPFAVTAPNAALTAAPGSTYALAWNVLGTDQAPVSCPAVQVLFSTDGGLTFPTVLLASTPNDGTQTVQFPNVNTTKGRFKIQALNNVFFAVNNANLTLAGPLPVELTAFTAEAHGPTAHLAWHTASEKNNAGFAVESSTDGTSFRRLGWVEGQGSSSTPSSYQFDDAALTTYPGPTAYYRLRQLDHNGPESLSPVRAVPVTASAAGPLQVWPNPAAGTVKVAGLAAGQPVQVLDLAGRVRLTATQAGRGALQLELTGLAPGLYVVRGNGTAVRLMVQ